MIVRLRPWVKVEMVRTDTGVVGEGLREALWEG